MGVPPVVEAILVAVGLSFALARLTRGIMFPAVNSDAEKQVRAAAQSRRWRWPSDMHAYAGNKAYMKDVGVLALATTQRLLRDGASAYPVTVLALVSHAASAALVFQVAQGYWATPVAWLLFALYLASCWPLQVVLLGGYQGLAQALVLAAIASLQQAGAPGTVAQGLWLTGAGIAIGLMMFTSASARKYLPLAVGAFLFSQRAAIKPLGLSTAGWSSLTSGAGPWILAASALLALAVSLLRPFGKLIARRLISAIYLKRAPRWLHGVIGARKQVPLEQYLGRQDRLVAALSGAGGVALAYLALCLMLSREPSFYAAQGWLLLGVGLVIAGLTSPDTATHLKAYLGYWNAAAMFGHFRVWADYFSRIGRPIDARMRGGGSPWLLRFFLRMAPWHAVLSAGGAVWLVLSASSLPAMGAALTLILLGLSPILFGELTRSPQLARAYFPALLGLLLPIGAAVSRLDGALSGSARAWGWSCLAAFVAAAALWGWRVFLDDLWPSRMAATRLVQALRSLGIRRFATYDTAYNESLVGVLPPEMRAQFDIRFISTLAEAKDGHVVVPATSGKSFDMATQRVAITDGDFTADPDLDRLIASGEIARFAVASFKTFGASRFWAQEDEVASFRDLILGEVRDADRRRGRAWLVDAEKLHAERAGAMRVRVDAPVPQEVSA